MMKRFLLLYSLLTIAFAAPTLRADTFFYFTSATSSWIGHGQTLTLTSVSANRYTYMSGYYANTVIFNAGGYQLSLIGTAQTVPTIGFYANATRWPFMGSGPGMAFTAPGRTDNTLTGYFNVLQADYDSTGQISAFAVDFYQRDEGIATWWNQGSVRYNSSIPMTIPEPSTWIAGLALCTVALFRFRPCKRSGS